VAVGTQALYSGTSATNNSGVGEHALRNVTGSYNDAFGWWTLKGAAGSTATENSAFGRLSMYQITTGAYNTGLGGSSLQALTSGSYNTALGYDAIRSNQSNNNIVAIGYRAGYSATTAGNSVLIGSNAGFTGNGDYGYNVFVGHYAGYNNVNSSGGYGNTYVGGNSSTGYGAGYAMTSGSNNAIFGGYSGNQSGSGSATLDLRVANGNIILSDGSGNPRGRYTTTGTYEQRADNYAYKRVIVAGSAFDNPTVNLMMAALNGSNQMVAVKVSVIQAVYASTSSNEHIGMASAQNNGTGTATTAVTSMTITVNNGTGNVGTLSWSVSGNNATLRYTANRVGNYDGYFIKIEIANGNNNAITLY
jgi:hypothetical protein